MKRCYIHSAVSISSQNTFESTISELKLTSLSGKKNQAIYPEFKQFIAPMALRRMATGVKMGVTAASRALQLASLEQPDAILVGSGMGCIEDTETFLNAIIDSGEDFLTPTAFIQSTHNTVGAQIALVLKCHAYNNTYVHGALSFESALLDAQLLLQQAEANTLLVGAVDELGRDIIDAVRMMEDKTANGINVPFSEGASFFVLSTVPKPESIELMDLQSFSHLSKNSINERILRFLNQNNLTVSDIDGLVLGTNGDHYDDYYEALTSVFPGSIPHIAYKKWSGEFYTASAFGLFLAYQILKSDSIPYDWIQNKANSKEIKTLLLYNQFKGRDHSFILIRK